MRTNQYAFIVVLQVLLLCGTFTFEAKMFNEWRNQTGTSDFSEVQQVPGDPAPDNLIDYLSR